MNHIDELHTAVGQLFNGVTDLLHHIHTDVKELKFQNRIDGDFIMEFNDVCQMLHMSERQVRRFREQNRLKGFLLDGRRMYRHSEVQEFLQNITGSGKLTDEVKTNY